jgi:tRNA1Val (adenine37-N6)-methyltransferase
VAAVTNTTRVARVRTQDGQDTQDTLFEGRLALAQPARGSGYRVNVDAVLLAEFAALATRQRPARAAFDLGSGVGAVGLSLLHLGATEHVTLVEIDAALAKLAEANVRANGWPDRAAVVRADVGDLEALPAGAADLVVCNPPYVEPGRGREPAAGHARARSGPLSVFLDAARRLAGRRARVCFVYPAIELTTLLVELRARGLEPKRLRAVHGRAQDKARIILIECAAGRPGGLVIEPLLVETRSP